MKKQYKIKLKQRQVFQTVHKLSMEQKCFKTFISIKSCMLNQKKNRTNCAIKNILYEGITIKPECSSRYYSTSALLERFVAPTLLYLEWTLALYNSVVNSDKHCTDAIILHTFYLLWYATVLGKIFFLYFRHQCTELKN